MVENSNNLIFTIPTTASSAGVHSIYIKASTTLEVHTYLKVELTLIDPCVLEAITLLNSDTIAKTFTMKESHLPTDLIIDLTKEFKSNMADKLCVPLTYNLVQKDTDGIISIISTAEKSIFKI